MPHAMRGPWEHRGQALFARRPLAPIAIALLAGIMAAGEVRPWPWVWCAAAGSLIMAAVFLRRYGQTATLLLVGAFVFLGLAAAQNELNQFSSSHIAVFTADEPKLAELRLKITTPPRILSSAQFGRPLPPKQLAHGEVCAVKTHDGWQSASGEILLTIDQPHPALAMAQQIEVIGMLQRPAPAMNPGQFDAAAYYRKQRILATMNVPHVDGVKILAWPSASWLDQARERARHLLASGFAQSQSLSHSILLALTLGDRDPEMRGVQEDFSNSGTAHLLAVSGLHVILIAGCALLICRLAGISPRWATFVMMAVVLLYASIAVPAAPVFRATVLCLALGLAQLTQRHRDGIQALSACAILLLFVHPHELFTAGFQLSFVTVLGMLLYGRKINEWRLKVVEDRDQRVARLLQPPGPWRTFLFHVKAHLIGALGMGLIAWLISVPLVMMHFDQFNSWAVLAGLLLLPSVALSLIGGLAKIVLTLLLPGFAGVWAKIAAAPVAWMQWEVHGLAHLPGAHIPLSSPPAWLWVFLYGLLILPLLPWTIPALRSWLRAAPAVAALIAMLPMLMGAARAPGGETRVTLLSIGAGQMAVLELPDGRIYLIDDGSSSIADPFRRCLEPYLRSRGCGSIEQIFLSHPDFDHISAVAETVDEYKPTRVCFSGVFRAQARGNAPAEEMLHHLDDTHVQTATLSRGQSIRLDTDDTLEVLWPPEGRSFTSTNNAGVVLRLSAHGRSVLFPADIQVPTERELIDHPENLAADVLVAPHHGSMEISTPQFVRAVHPRYIVSSSDRRLSKKQKEFDHATADIPSFRTGQSGAITIHLSRAGELTIEPFRSTRK